jgi:hypothetical protein
MHADAADGSNLPASPNPVGVARGDQSDFELYLPGLFGRSKALIPLQGVAHDANKRLARDDVGSARKMLVKALQEAQRGDWDIWEGRSDANAAFGLLFSRCGPVGEVLRAIAGLVMAENHASSWRVAERVLLAAVNHLDGGSRRDLFAVLVEHVEHLIRAERAQLSVAEEIEDLPTQISPLSGDECLDELLVSLIDHPNWYMRARAADVIELLARSSVVHPQLLIDHILKTGPREGREVAVGLLHRFVSLDPSRAGEVAACSGFDRLAQVDGFLARFIVEECGGTWQGAPSTPVPAAAPPEAYRWSEGAARLLRSHPGARAEAARLVEDLCAPMSAAEVKELTEIRMRAFGLPEPPDGYAFEREAIFRALAGIQGASERQGVLTCVVWNPMWPDADLRLGWSPVADTIHSALEADTPRSAFVVADKTILHCVEFAPPESGGEYTITEVVSVLVPDAFFNDDLDYGNIWEGRSVRARGAPAITESILAPLHEPAIIRFEEMPTIGGQFTPAAPSGRLTQLIGLEGVDRICWREGRRWDAWGPGPGLARGTATLVETSRIEAIREYRLVWVVIINSQLRFVVDPSRNRITEVSS